MLLSFKIVHSFLDRTEDRFAFVEVETSTDFLGFKLDEALDRRHAVIEGEVKQLFFRHSLSLVLGPEELVLPVLANLLRVSVNALLQQNLLLAFDHLLVLPVFRDVNDSVRVQRQLFLKFLLLSIAIRFKRFETSYDPAVLGLKARSQILHIDVSDAAGRGL